MIWRRKTRIVSTHCQKVSYQHQWVWYKKSCLLRIIKEGSSQKHQQPSLLRELSAAPRPRAPGQWVDWLLWSPESDRVIAIPPIAPFPLSPSAPPWADFGGDGLIGWCVVDRLESLVNGKSETRTISQSYGFLIFPTLVSNQAALNQSFQVFSDQPSTWVYKVLQCQEKMLNLKLWNWPKCNGQVFSQRI